MSAAAGNRVSATDGTAEDMEVVVETFVGVSDNAEENDVEWGAEDGNTFVYEVGTLAPGTEQEITFGGTLTGTLQIGDIIMMKASIRSSSGSVYDPDSSIDVPIMDDTEPEAMRTIYLPIMRQ